MSSKFDLDRESERVLAEALGSHFSNENTTAGGEAARFGGPLRPTRMGPSTNPRLPPQYPSNTSDRSNKSDGRPSQFNRPHPQSGGYNEGYNNNRDGSRDPQTSSGGRIDGRDRMVHSRVRFHDSDQDKDRDMNSNRGVNRNINQRASSQPNNDNQHGQDVEMTRSSAWGRSQSPKWDENDSKGLNLDNSSNRNNNSNGDNSNGVIATQSNRRPTGQGKEEPIGPLPPPEYYTAVARSKKMGLPTNVRQGPHGPELVDEYFYDRGCIERFCVSREYFVFALLLLILCIIMVTFIGILWEYD